MTDPGQSNIEELGVEIPRGSDPLKVRCPKCGAPPREHCSTDTGEPAPTHKARSRLASYKPVQP